MEPGDSARELAWIRARVLDVAPAEHLAVIATNLQGVVAYWNMGAERLYGWSQDEALGRSIVELTPTAATRERSDEIMGTLREGASWRGEIQLQRKDGALMDAFVIDIPLGDIANAQGAIVGISARAAQRRAVAHPAALIETRLRRRFAAS